MAVETEPQRLDAFLEATRSRTARVGVVGLGFVSLPLVLLFEESGFPVLAFDVDVNKTQMLNRGESYIRHIGVNRVRNGFQNSRAEATTDFDRLILVASTAHSIFNDPSLYSTVKLAVDRRNIVPRNSTVTVVGA